MPGQSISNLDNQVKFSDYITDDVSKSGLCIRKAYYKLIALKNKPGLYINQSEILCVAQPKESYYKNAGEGDRVQHSWEAINQLHAKNNDLVAYVRLKDFQLDSCELGIKLINQMAALIDELVSDRNKLMDAIDSAGKDLSDSALGKVYQQMFVMARHEEEVLKHLDADHKNKRVDIDVAFIIQSYIETEDLIKEFKPDELLQHHAARFLKSFLDNVRNLQLIKKKRVDENNYQKQKTSEYVNELYQDLLVNFNQGVLSFFNAYVRNALDHEISLGSYPKFMPACRLEGYVKNVKIETTVFTEKPTPELVINKGDTFLNRSTYDLLNRYVIVLNGRTDAVGKNQNIFSSFQSRMYSFRNLPEPLMNRWRVKNYPFKWSFTYSNFTIPEIDLIILKKETIKLLPDYGDQLINQLGNIQELLLEIESRCHELHNYAAAIADYNELGFEYPEEVLRRLLELFDTYESKKERLYSDIRKIYSSYPVHNPTSPWVVTGNEMLKTTEVAEATLTMINKKITNNATEDISTDDLLLRKREMISNQSKNMAGISRISNGFCPYKPYEQIPDEIDDMVKKIGYFEMQPGRSSKIKYSDYVSSYNSISGNYNKYAEISLGENEYAKSDEMRPVFVLYQTMKTDKFVWEDFKPKVR